MTVGISYGRLLNFDDTRVIIDAAVKCPPAKDIDTCIHKYKGLSERSKFRVTSSICKSSHTGIIHVPV